MVASGLRNIVLLLAVLAATAAGLCGLATPLVLLAALAGPVLAVSVLVLLSYLVAGVNPLRGGAGEWIMSLKAFLVLQPFPRRFADPHLAGGDGLPVLLVHGYGCNRGVYRHLARRLRDAGFRPRAVDLEPVYGSIDDYVAPLRARIGAVLAETGATRLALVAHSMGGLAARALLARTGAGGIGLVVTLGSPHHGTRLARLGPGRDARQMEPGSAWLAALATQEPPALPFLSIRTAHDNIVAPASSAHLPWADNVAFEDVGHLALLEDERVCAAVIERLRAL